MKTRNRWMLVLLVLVVAACVGWFVASFTTKGSHSATIEVFLYRDQNVEQIFSAASATVNRFGYKTSDGTSSFSTDDKSNMSLKAKHEDGIVVEIYVDSKTDARTRLRIRLTEKRDDFSLYDVIDVTAPLRERASRILEAITASLESP